MRRRNTSAVLAMAVCLAVSDAADATVLTWDASGLWGDGNNQDGGGNWVTAGHWRNGTGPGNWTNGDTATFGVNNGAAGTVIVESFQNVNAGGLVFNAPGSGAYTVTLASAFNSTLTVGSSGITANADATVVPMSSGATLDLGANQNWNIAAGKTLTTGRISTHGYNIVKQGDGTLTLKTTYNSLNATSQIQMQGGILRLDQPQGIGTLLSSATTLSFDGAGTSVVAANPDGGIAGPIRLNYSGTINVLNSNDISIGGALSGSGDLIKVGSGFLETGWMPNGNTGFSGQFVIREGTVRWNNGGNLLGSGTILMDGGFFSNSAGRVIGNTINFKSGDMDGMYNATTTNIQGGATLLLGHSDGGNNNVPDNAGNIGGTVNVLAGGTLTGAGNLKHNSAAQGSVGALNVYGTLAPGISSTNNATFNGLFYSTNTTMMSGSTYLWEVRNANFGTMPSGSFGWDTMSFLTAGDNLTIEAGSTFQVSDMGVTPDNWDANTPRDFMLANFNATGAHVFGVENWTVDTSLFTAPTAEGYGWWIDAPLFSPGDGNQYQMLYLHYGAVPEPTIMTGIGVGCLALLRRHRQSRRPA